MQFAENIDNLNVMSCMHDIFDANIPISCAPGIEESKADSASEVNQKSPADTRTITCGNHKVKDDVHVKLNVNSDSDTEHVLSKCPFVCGLCDLKVNSISTYLAHFQVHDYVCENLHYCFERDLAEDDKNSVPYLCGLCGASYLSLCTLYKHLVCDEGMHDFVFLRNERTAYDLKTLSKQRRYSGKDDHANKVCSAGFTETVNEGNSILSQSKGEHTWTVEGEQKPHICENVGAKSEGGATQESSEDSMIYSEIRNVKETPEDDRFYKSPDYDTSAETMHKVCSNDNVGTELLDRIVSASVDSCDCVQIKTAQKKETGRKVLKMAKSNKTKSMKKLKAVTTCDEKTESEKTEDHTTVIQTDVKSTRRDKDNEKHQNMKMAQKGCLQKEEFPCETCGKMFKYKSLRAHRRSHEKHIIPCDMCNLKFKCRSAVLSHKAQVHAVGKKFMCDECGKSFKALAYLRQHSQTHKKERDLKCPVCGKMFLYKNVLRPHMLTHSEKRPHTCPICGKGFKRQHDINVHMEGVHESVEKYPCTVCDKKFITNDRLRKHKVVHQPPKFTCQFCAKMFRTNSNLKIHLKVHGIKQEIQTGIFF